MLIRQGDPRKARDLAEALAKLELDPDERAPAVQALLALLAHESDPYYASMLAKTLADLGPSERTMAAHALVALRLARAIPGRRGT